MSFLKDIKPQTKMTFLICITIAIVALIAGAAYTGCVDVLIDKLFGLAGASK